MGGRKPTQSESVFLIGSVSPINRPYLFLRTNHHLYAEIRTVPNSVQDRLPAYLPTIIIYFALAPFPEYATFGTTIYNIIQRFKLSFQ